MVNYVRCRFIGLFCCSQKDNVVVAPSFATLLSHYRTAMVPWFYWLLLYMHTSTCLCTHGDIICLVASSLLLIPKFMTAIQRYLRDV